MGRPSEFDREQVLERAMQVFWAEGYEKACVQKLCEATGLHRGSLYNAFGDKHALFEAALARYRARLAAQLSAVLDREGSALDNVRALLAYKAQACSGDDGRHGCLVTRTAAGLGDRDERIGEALRSILRETEDALARCLERAVAEGELPPGYDTRASARFLLATLHGLTLVGQALRDCTVTDDVVATALRVFAPVA